MWMARSLPAAVPYVPWWCSDSSKPVGEKCIQFYTFCLPHVLHLLWHVLDSVGTCVAQ